MKNSPACKDLRFFFQMGFSASLSSDNKDFESIVLMRMRQAEERKRLIEQMEKEDGEKT